MTLDYEAVTKAVRQITEDITNITTSATIFRDEVEDSYGVYQLTFLRSISTAMGSLEAASKQLQSIFVEIQDGLNAYIKEFDEYSEGGFR